MGRTLLALLCALLHAGLAFAGDGAAKPEPQPEKVPLRTARANEKGNDLVRKGKYPEAAEVYREEALRRPENGVLQRNLAGALSRSGALEEGLAAYGQAIRFSDTPKEKAKALYDLGTALALSGQMEPAMQTYAQAMLMDPEDMDLKHNFEFLLKRMQEQQQEQQESGDGEQDEQQEPQEGDQENADQEAGEDESQPQPQEGEEDQPQPQPQPDQQQQDAEQMNPEDAQRLLDALLEEEKELQAERNRKLTVNDPNVEKDW